MSRSEEVMNRYLIPDHHPKRELSCDEGVQEERKHRLPIPFPSIANNLHAFWDDQLAQNHRHGI